MPTWLKHDHSPTATVGQSDVTGNAIVINSDNTIPMPSWDMGLDAGNYTLEFISGSTPGMQPAAYFCIGPIDRPHQPDPIPPGAGWGMVGSRGTAAVSQAFSVMNSDVVVRLEPWVWRPNDFNRRPPPHPHDPQNLIAPWWPDLSFVFDPPPPGKFWLPSQFVQGFGHNFYGLAKRLDSDDYIEFRASSGVGFDALVVHLRVT